jgi:hypothetical protein
MLLYIRRRRSRVKALGIIAMIFAIVAIFVPVFGPYLTLVCALIAAFSAGPGLTFGIVAIGVNVLNVAFLSPSLWLLATAAESNETGAGSDVLVGLGILFISAQVLAAIVLGIVHFAWKRKQPDV